MIPTFNTLVFCGWLALGIIWGTTWIVIKIGHRDLPPFTFAGLRFGLAVVPLLCILAVRRELRPRRNGDWLLMPETALLTITWNYGLVFWASRTISSGQTVTLHATLPSRDRAVSRRRASRSRRLAREHEFPRPDECMSATQRC